MDDSTHPFIQSLDAEVDRIIDACTACGRCAEVCPTVDIIDVRDATNETITRGVIDILKGSIPANASEKWSRACCGTGHCLDVCPESINPRVMLAMARRSLNGRRPEGESHAQGREMFKTMSKGVRMLSQLQMPPEVLNRLNPRKARADHGVAPDLVFYTGCNMLKTPHIGLTCLDLFDRIGISYEVYGGPGNCCGILQFRAGDMESAGRIATSTIERFEGTGTSDVVAWCPTCHIHFNEIALPSVSGGGPAPFDMHMLPIYLADRLDLLRPHFKNSIVKRVALFEFPGARGVTEAVRKLMDAVPGVEYVDLGLENAGYQMSALETVPNYRSETIAEILRAAEKKNVDVLCSVFHSDHREISSHAQQWPYEMKNYMDIVGESMGIHHDDLFQRLKIMQDADQIVGHMTDTVSENDLDLEQMRDAVLEYMLGDQLLPIDREKQPAQRD